MKVEKEKIASKTGVSTTVDRLMKLIHIVVLFALLITGSTALAQVCGITSNTDAQVNTQVWWAGHSTLGDEYTLDFSSGSVVQTNAATGQSAGVEGTATYTNSAGLLLLYTDGIKIFNGQTNVQIANNIGGDPSATQAAAIVPIPGGDPTNDFYVFWNDAGFSTFGYITVDLAAGTATGNTVLNTVDERLTVIPHGNGTDFWVVTTRVNTNPDTFYVYKVDSVSVTLENTQQPTGINGGVQTSGSIVFSPATNKIAYSVSNDSIYIADFDVNTGLISNEQLRMSGLSGYYSVAFSPDGNRLFTTVALFAGTPSYHELSGSVNNVTNVSGAPVGYAGTRLAPDGKIYFADVSSSILGVVSDPDGTPTWSTLSIAPKVSGLNFPNASYAACNILKPPCLIYDAEPYDINEATYKGKQINFGTTPADLPREIEFNSDGSKMYVLFTNTSTIKEYDLSTHWDNTTAVYSGNFISGLGTPYGFKFAPDGSRFFLADPSIDRVHQYDLSPAWDINSATLITSLTAVENNILDVTFNDDGTKMYLAGTGQDISEYDLSPSYTLAGFTYVQSFSTSAVLADPRGVEFSNDGLYMFITGSGSNAPNKEAVHRYNLGTAWDISTAVIDSSFSVAAQYANPAGLAFSADGKYFYISGGFGGLGIHDITRYCVGLCDFTETDPTNDGSITAGEELTITLENETFINAGGTLTNGVDYTITNLPASFVPNLAVDVGGASATLTLTGNADPGTHYDANDLANLQFNWATSAFTTAALPPNTCAGGSIVDSNVGIDFFGDPPCLNYRNAWDVSQTTYNGDIESLFFGEEETNSGGLFFKPDGTRLFLIGQTGDAIVEYDLEIPWDISTALYNGLAEEFSTTLQESQPEDLFFKPDGTRLFVIGFGGESVVEYELIIPWDVSSAIYNGISEEFSVNSEEDIPYGLFFKPDGDRMFVIGSQGDSIVEYDLMTSWDVSTAVYNGITEEFSVSAQETDPRDLFFHPDGNRMFVIGTSGVSIVEYDLSTPWDVSSAVYNGLLEEISGIPEDLFFKPDGTRLFVMNGITDMINEYDLRTKFTESDPANDGSITAGEQTTIFLENDTFTNAGGALTHGVDYTITNLPASLIPNLAVDVSGANATLTFTGNVDTGNHFDSDDLANLQFNWAGTAFTTNAVPPSTCVGGDVVDSYIDLDFFGDTACIDYGSPWDVSTASYNGSAEEYRLLPDGHSAGVAVFFKPDGTRMFVVENTNDYIAEYDLDVPWDISTAIYNGVSEQFSVTNEEDQPFYVFFKPDGLRMFVIGQGDDSIVEYDLTTAWDVSTAIYNGVSQEFYVGAQEIGPRGLFFKPDGTRMFIVGISEDAVFEYDLTTPWDVSSAKYNGGGQKLSIISQDNLPNGLFFKPDGSRMFIVGQTGNAIVEYDLATPWDVSTAVYNGISEEFSMATAGTAAFDIFFTPQGNRLYIVDITGQDAVHEYDLGHRSFTESNPSNDGMITSGETLSISIEFDTFSNASGTLTHGVDYTITNLPSTITPILAVAADGLTATLTFTGSADTHFDANDIAELLFTWNASAFASGLLPSATCDAGPLTNSGVGVDLIDLSDYNSTESGYTEAEHIVGSSLVYLGATPADSEAMAGTDDTTGTDDEDDVDFVPIPVSAVQASAQPGDTYSLDITAFNNSGGDAIVCGWVDFDINGQTGDGSYENDEGVCTRVSTSASSQNFTLTWTLPADFVYKPNESTFARLRITQDASWTGEGSIVVDDPPAGPITATAVVMGGEVEEHEVPIQTLPVSLSSFTSKQTGRRLQVNWTTGSELFNVGFQLWGMDKKQKTWQPLNRFLVRSRIGSTAEPQSYRRKLRLPNSIDELMKLGISSMDGDGQEHYYGPFDVGKDYGELIALEPIDWDKTRAQLTASMESKGYVYDGIRKRYRKVATSQTLADLDSNEQAVVEFNVDRAGMYRITGAQLLAAGIDWREVPRGEIALIDAKGDAQVRVIYARGSIKAGRGSNRALGEAGEIVFYGEPPLTNAPDKAGLYSKVGVYRLIRDRSQARPMPLQRRQRLSSGFVDSYREHQVIEPDKRYALRTTVDDPWIDRSVVSYRNRAEVIEQQFNVPSDVDWDQAIDFQFSVGRVSGLRAKDADGDGVQDDEHLMQGLVVSGEGELHYLDTRTAVGSGAWLAQFTAPLGVDLSDEANQVTLGAKFSPGAGYRLSSIQLDYYGLSYVRPLVAHEGEHHLWFKQSGEFSESGYQVQLPPARGRLTIFAKAGNNLTRIAAENVSQVTNAEGDAQRRIRFARLAGDELLAEDDQIHYWVSGVSGFYGVKDIAAKRITPKQTLVDQAVGSSYLIVVHPGINEASWLDSYLGHLSARGEVVIVVDYLNVVNSFGGGQAGPNGLKRYLAAVNKAQGEQKTLKHVLLVGNSTYDHTDILTTGALTLIPSPYGFSGNTSYTPTDADYVLDESGELFASIGRVPARTTAQMAYWVNKQLKWTAGVNQKFDEVVLLGESTDNRGNQFTPLLEALSGIMPDDTNQHKVYVESIIEANPSLSLSEAVALTKQTFLSRLSESPELVLFSGHGSSDRLSNLNLYGLSDIKSYDGISLWLPLSCFMTYAEGTHVDSLAHQLLFSGDAVLISGAQALSSISVNALLAKGIVGGMNDGLSLGRSVNKVHNRLNNGPMRVNWSILGDPGLRQ